MKCVPLLNQGLPRLVCRMGLAGKDELHRSLRIKLAGEASRAGSCSRQVRSLVVAKAPCEAQSQCVGIKQMFRPVNRLGRRAGDAQLPGQSLAGVFNKRTCRGTMVLKIRCALLR